MTSEKTLEILKEMKTDPKAKELFEGMEKPGSLDEAISAYARIAEKLGYGITEEDIRETIKQEEASRKAKTDKVVTDMEALEDDDVEDVAGGVKIYTKPYKTKNNGKRCYATHIILDICWENDVCSISVN